LVQATEHLVGTFSDIATHLTKRNTAMQLTASPWPPTPACQTASDLRSD
jgi:hypothetical protein